MRTKDEASCSQFITKLADLVRNLAILHGEVEVTEPQVEQFIVRPIGPFRFHNGEGPDGRSARQMFMTLVRSRRLRQVAPLQFDAACACCNPATYKGAGFPCLGSPQ